VEEDILVATPHAPPRPIYFSPVAWARNRSRCAERTSRVLIRKAPVARGFMTDPVFYGLTPNHAGAILRPNGRLIETQPLHMCQDGSMVSFAAPPGWQGGSILTGDRAHHIHLGAHGASGLTAFGGTIRLGEWVPGGIIPHAVKIEVWGARYLSSTHRGFRWPADHADTAYRAYGGSLPYMRMGSLLALPPDFKIRGLHSRAAKVLARTLKTYGAYVVGNTGRDTIAFATEWGPAGRVISQFQHAWGFPLSGTLSDAHGRQRKFLKALKRVYKHLAVVTDNSPRHIGGKGKRLAPLAPPLAPLTKQTSP
jgi:hypothetical protein